MRKLVLAVCFAAVLLSGSVYAAEEVQWALGREVELMEKAIDVALSGDGKYAYILTKKNVTIQNLQNGRIIGMFPLDAKFTSISLAPRANSILLKSSSGKKILSLQANIKIPEPVFDIPVDGSPIIGPAEARVTLVTFTDFQCPHCSRVFPAIEQLLKKYPNDLNVIIKHFPLRSHKFASQASIATLAAARQGKYVELTREMFKNYRSLNEETVKEYAGAVGLDLEKFEQDRKNNEFQQQLQRDRQLGRSIGVRGVPSLYINGRSVKNRSPQGMAAMIDEELKNQ
jgi:protein-disulfide isomerase